MFISVQKCSITFNSVNSVKSVIRGNSVNSVNCVNSVNSVNSVSSVQRGATFISDGILFFKFRYSRLVVCLARDTTYNV